MKNAWKKLYQLTLRNRHKKREEIAIFSEYEKELQLMQTCIKKPSEETMQKIYSRIRLLNIQSN